MAKKLPWGTFTHEDLLVDREDDIYLNFLFARLNDNGFGMEKARNFKRSLNNVRGTETTCESKKVGLQGSFAYGWDRTGLDKQQFVYEARRFKRVGERKKAEGGGRERSVATK